jgi:DNA topoisomerase-6 subunit B
MEEMIQQQLALSAAAPPVPAESAEPRGTSEPRQRSTRRRVTAEAMASKQRDISVSEFFAKNRHLLGFDNPRKALLTAVKEAVDNSLDACEEAGIVPELWVHLESTGPNRYKVGVQDNGPGIVKKQIPLIFGKLLYGSKFHRLRMSRGQQGIGISAAGMYGMLTTGKPVKILSMTSPRKPSHYFEIQIDTRRNQPEIINGRGEGEEIPPGEKGHQVVGERGIEWVMHYPVEGEADSRKVPKELKSGTRVTIEMEARYQRGRGSVDEYLEQTAIANPHVTIHYTDPDGGVRTYVRSTTELPAEPQEIKPHPYGVELGRLVTMLKETENGSMSQFLQHSFSRVSPATAQAICEAAKISTRANPKKIGRQEADALYQAIQNTKIPAPATNCISPIGEALILKGLHQQVPGEFFCAATRPPSVYRGNPFLIEVGLAYGAASPTEKVTLETLKDLLNESDARSVRQFLLTTFDGVGAAGVEKILTEARLGARQTVSKLGKEDTAKLHEAMRNVNLSEGQAVQVLRYANRVPLLFQPAACAITQAVIQNNWRAYGLSQSRGQLPSGPITLMVHMASVWVPFTSESKEAIASYPEIMKELRLALQAVGRKLQMFLNQRNKVRQEGERREIFLRYIGEVAGAVASIKDYSDSSKKQLYARLMDVARRKTAVADVQMDDRGKKVALAQPDFGDNVLIVNEEQVNPLVPVAKKASGAKPKQAELAFDEDGKET